MERRAQKFTPAVRETILEALRKGLPVRMACGLARISHAQFYRWMDRGKDAGPETTWHQFYLDVERAFAEAVDPRVTRITQAAIDGDWRADAWMLERRFPADFGARDRIERQPQQVVVELAFPGAPALASLPSSVVTVEQDSGTPAA